MYAAAAAQNYKLPLYFSTIQTSTCYKFQWFETHVINSLGEMMANRCILHLGLFVNCDEFDISGWGLPCAPAQTYYHREQVGRRLNNHQNRNVD